MKRILIAALVCGLLLGSPAGADTIGDDGGSDGDAETVPDAVRVTIVVSGGHSVVQSVRGRPGAAQEGCVFTVVYAPELDDTPYGTNAGPKPDPEARFALLLCNGNVMVPIWVAPSDIIDLDAAAQIEAQRYIEDVLIPDVSIGVNPTARGLVGLPSWFWIDGFSGSVVAPTISAFGVSIDVRMSSGTVTWSFGDGTVVAGGLGQAYPTESSVQHTHQRDGDFTVTAAIDLVPEYRVNGGPWITLPGLQAVTTVVHQVEQRQAVITNT